MQHRRKNLRYWYALRIGQVILNYNPYRLGYMPSQWFICFAQLQYNLLVQPYRYTILVVNLNRHLHKDFPRSQASSGSNARSCSTTAEPSKCNEHGTIQKGSVQCTVGAVGFSCLLYTTIYSANWDIQNKAIFEFINIPGNSKYLSVL